MDINATLCNKIVDNMVKYVENDKETQKEKLNYYIRVIMDGVGNFAIMLLVFLLSGFGIEYIACYIALSVTRTFLGGFHLKTGDQCLVMTFGVFYVCIVHFSLKDELYLFWKAIILEIKKCILGLPSILFILSYAYTGKIHR